MAAQQNRLLAQLTPEEIAQGLQSLGVDVPAPEDVYTLPPTEIVAEPIATDNQLGEGVNPETGVVPDMTAISTTEQSPSLELQTYDLPQDRLLALLRNPEQEAAQRELLNRSQAAIDEQRQGLQDNEASTKEFQDRGVGTNMAPLASLIDNWTGSNFASSYKQPMSEEERALKLMELKRQLQDQRKGLSQAEIDLLKTQMNDQALRQLQTFAGRKDLADYRAANQARDRILQRLSTNKDLGARLNAYQALDNALSNMAAGEVRTPEQFVEFQDAIIAGLGFARGQSGVNERADRRFNNLELKSSKLMQFLTSEPQDILKNKGLVKHLQDLARQEMVNVKSQYNKRLRALGAGYDRLLARHPDVKLDLADGLAAFAGQFETPAKPDITKLKKGQAVHVGPQPPPFAPVPGEKKKKGSTKDLNADLDNMTPEQLETWVQTHGQ